MKSKLIGLLAVSFWLLAFGCWLMPVRGQTESKSAMDRGCSFLAKVQQENGAICDTVNPLFNIWETILAARALYAVQKDTNGLALKKALAYLYTNENPQGLICHNQKCKAGYCLETTAEYFLLLAEIGQKQTIQTRLPLVIALQKPEGDWDIGNPNVQEVKNFPSVTGFTLAMMEAGGLKAQSESTAYEWLLSKQDAKGHWGQSWEYYDCPAYGLWAVLRALKGEFAEADIVAKERAIRYMLEEQREDGSWYFVGSVPNKVASAALQTALMLAAIEYVSFENKDKVVKKGLEFLLKTQRADGSWDGGYFPIASDRYIKLEYIFATSMAIKVLQHYDKE